jgi:hypothetical protein
MTTLSDAAKAVPALPVEELPAAFNDLMHAVARGDLTCDEAWDRWQQALRDEATDERPAPPADKAGGRWDKQAKSSGRTRRGTPRSGARW